MDGPLRFDLTVEEVFADFKSRCAGIIKALTTEAEEFYRQCDPKKDSLYLMGLPNGNWELLLPAGPFPPELPEPTVGINFPRDGMQEKDWLVQVAVCSDSWLVSVAFFTGSRCNFNKAKRKRLFTKINSLPTVSEIVKGFKKKPTKKEPSVSNQRRKKSKPSLKGRASKKAGINPKGTPKNESEAADEEGCEENGEYICGACGDKNTPIFWICCDTCEKWFHGVCVKVTPQRAKRIKRYKCPICSHKKARPRYRKVARLA